MNRKTGKAFNWKQVFFLSQITFFPTAKVLNMIQNTLAMVVSFSRNFLLYHKLILSISIWNQFLKTEDYTVNATVLSIKHFLLLYSKLRQCRCLLHLAVFQSLPVYLWKFWLSDVTIMIKIRNFVCHNGALAEQISIISVLIGAIFFEGRGFWMPAISQVWGLATVAKNRPNDLKLNMQAP